MAQGWKTWTATVLWALLASVTLVVGGISIWFVEDGEPFPRSANVLITSFAVGMTLLAATSIIQVHRTGSMLAWAGLWAYPIFFAYHVVEFKTYVPDIPLGVVGLVALFLRCPWTWGKKSTP